MSNNHIKGGQGRSTEDIHKSASVLALIAVALVGWLIVAIIWRATYA